MEKPRLVTAPAVQPITVDECRAHLRIDFGDDDDVVQALVAAAISHLDGWSGILGRCLITQVWAQDFAGWGRGELRLPFPDVCHVEITYIDENGIDRPLPPECFFLRHDCGGSYILIAGGRPALSSVHPFPITISMTAGYGANAADVPASIRHALKMLVGHWYENREATSEKETKPVPMAFNALTAAHRFIKI